MCWPGLHRFKTLPRPGDGLSLLGSGKGLGSPYRAGGGSLVPLGMHLSKAFPQFIAGNSSAPSVTGRLFKACGSTWSDANSVAHFDAASRCFSRAVLSPPRCETSGNDV